MVTKNPANSTATSTIGPNVKALRSRFSLAVPKYAMSANATRSASCLPTAQGRPAAPALPAAMIVRSTPPSAATETPPRTRSGSCTITASSCEPGRSRSSRSRAH